MKNNFFKRNHNYHHLR